LAAIVLQERDQLQKNETLWEIDEVAGVGRPGHRGIFPRTVPRRLGDARGVLELGVRLGIVDLFAAAALVLALVLPKPGRDVRSLYFKEQTALAVPLAEAQAAVSRDPQGGAANARMADALVEVHQLDWAIRAGGVGANGKSPTAWRAAASVSAAFMERREIGSAADWGARAVAECDAAPAGGCGDDDHLRLEMYNRALGAVVGSGINLKTTSKGVSDAVDRAVPLIRLGGRRQ
jgi:hypothetical protein